MGVGTKPACTSTLEGQKDIFSYVNLQVNDSFSGVKSCKVFHFGGHCPRAPLQVRA